MNALVLISVILASPPVFAATYYIDFLAGHDEADGLTRATAWKTIPGTQKNNGVWADSLHADWGAHTVDSSHKVPPATVFKLRPGTTYDVSLGGVIWINNNFYTDTATWNNPIRFEVDPVWGTGPVVFDGTGLDLTTLIGILLIQNNGVQFDGNVPGGIEIRNSPRSGIHVKEKNGTGYPVLQSSFRNLKFFNNGTSYLTDTAGAGDGQLNVRHADGFTADHLECDGNHNFINGILLGDGHKAVINAKVTDSVAYSHQGDLVTNDAGIGFKALNGQVTFLRNRSYNNLKGFDLGEGHGDNRDMMYKLIDNTADGNVWGINLNSTADIAYTGKSNYFLINNLVYKNSGTGSNIYAGPFNLYAVHNVYADNGDTAVDGGNFRVTPDGTRDETQINVYLYNNIFYKPHALKYNWNLQVGYIGDGSPGRDTNFNLYSDYNAWVQNNTEPFAFWSFNAAPQFTYAYGVNGPGHAGGAWFAQEDEPGIGIGHSHCDAH
ncbi:MAG: hypothetical protein WCI27_08175, partial [Candidatus Omnitrophota bacterium]